MTKFKVDAEKQVSLAEEEASLAVDLDDWARIRRSLEKLGESSFDWMGTFAGVLIGAAIAVLGIIVSIKLGTTQPAAGLVTGLWVTFAFCGFFGLLLTGLGLMERHHYRVSNAAICEDMDEISTRLGHPGLGKPTPKQRPGLKRRLGRLWLGDPPSGEKNQRATYDT